MLKQTPKKRVLLVRRSSLLLLAFIGVFSFILVNFRHPSVAHAAAANTVNFQARLQSSAGAIVPDGNYNVEFKLYSASSGGSALWTEDYLNSGSQGLNTINGYLSANLGSLAAFPSTINWDQPLWLTMNIGGTSTGSATWDGEMNPRLPLTAVPYAFQANQLGSYNNATGYNSTLSIQGATGGDQNFVIQNQAAAGTYYLLTAPSGSDGYIKLQSSAPGSMQSGNLNISGSGVFNGAVLSPSVDTVSTATLSLGTATANGVSISQSGYATTVNGSLTVNQALSAQGGITIGAAAGSGTIFTNNGATVNATYALTDFHSGGSIGTAASTVDKYTAISIAQTTPAQTLTIPSPTDSTAYGKLLYITNNGTASFSLLSTTLNAGATATLIWSNTNSGASWTFAGTDKGSILNQTAQQTGANFNIAANSGVAATIQGSSGNDILDLKTSAGGSAGVYIDQYGNFNSSHQMIISMSTTGSLSLGNITLNNNSTTSTPSIANAFKINLSGAANSNGAGSNITNGIFMPSVTTQTGNTFNGLFFGTGYTSLITLNGASVIDGSGIVQSTALGSTITYTNLQKVGALNVGSITNGFGTISTDSSITTSTSVQGATVNGTTSVTTPLLQSTGALAIQSSGSNNITLSSNSAASSIVAQTKTNSATGFQIQNATNVALFNLDTTNGTITFGTGSNTVIFTSSGGLVANGTAQHTKQIALTAEYAGAVLDASNDSSCSSANNGTMTSGYDGSNNYYKWASGGTSQCYDVVVRIPLPSDFSSWSSSTPLAIKTYSSNVTTGTVFLDVRDTTGGSSESGCNFASATSATPGTANAWATMGGSCTLTGTYTAGQMMTLRIRMTGGSASDVRIGGITLSYNSKF